MSPGLDGTGRVADDLWLLAHNDVSGRAYLQPRALGLGLAAGLLAELALTGALQVRGDAIMPVRGRRPPSGDLLRRILGVLETEPQDHPVGDWLAFLARTAPGDVASRLQHSGYLAADRGILPWRGDRWRPVDRDSAFAPVLRVRAALDAAQYPPIPAVTLAGLADASGLGFRLAEYTPNRPIRPLHHAVAQLPPSLQDLIAYTRAAVDSALLSHRT